MDVTPPEPTRNGAVEASDAPAPTLCEVPGTAQPPTASAGSGGYLETVFRAAAKALFGRSLPDGPLPVRLGRNADWRELVLEDEVTGQTLLRFAAAYGFRNIQSVVRAIRGGRCTFDYVEVRQEGGWCLCALRRGGAVEPIRQFAGGKGVV